MRDGHVTGVQTCALPILGYQTATIPIEHNERKEGKSSYNISKLVALATDAIISQSNKPLRLSIQFGFLISLVSFIYGLYLFTRYFFLSEPVHGWTRDRKSTRLNSSHVAISYAVFCLKKKN